MADTPTPEQTEKPKNVIEALARVMAELPGIGKDAKSDQGYKYRGIESITAHAQRLLGKYGVVFVPRVVSRTVKDFTINSKPWTEDAAQVIYTVYGPGGIEDRIEVGPLIGLGRDNSDKGMNKSMTQAYKYALIQTLCIGDGKDDPDADVAREADARQAPPDPLQSHRDQLFEDIRALSAEGREKVRAYCDEHKIPRAPGRMDADQIAAVSAVVDAVYIAAMADTAAEAPVAPSEATQGPSMGDDSGTAPAEAPGPPAEAEKANGSVDAVQAAIDTVAGMGNSAIMDALRERNLDTAGNTAARAQRLAAALVDEHAPTA